MDQNRQAKATHVRTVKATDPIVDGQREPRADTPELGSWSDVVVVAARRWDLESFSCGAREWIDRGQPEPTASRSGAVILRVAGLALKTHTASCDGAALALRLRVACDVPALLSPLSADPQFLRTPVGERWVSVWPAVEPLRAGSAAQVAWREIGSVAARLHRRPPPVGCALPHGGLTRIRRVATGLDRLAAPSWLTGLAQRLADEASRPFELAATLVHGDLHLGQVGRGPAGDWLLFDVDDLGLGDPAWDLGKIAGLWAAGQLDHASWEEFLGGYRSADGPAVPAEGNPWPRLDLPARAAVLTTLFGLLRDRAAGQRVDENLVQELQSTCRRMSD